MIKDHIILFIKLKLYVRFMSLNHYFDDISFTPFRKELKGYTLSKLHSDLTAATAAALLTIPQSMAQMTLLTR